MKTAEKKRAEKINEKRRNARAAAYAEKIMREVEALERQGGSYDIDRAVDEAATNIKY